ncbi:MAG: GMC family oxidoreductase [Myxococcaceae bacterium]|nr:GMC family oxidoreductase [Myxococcaceae bacterium]
MSEGRIWTGDELTQDREVTCDVCIVGSGAGGGVLGEALARRGLSVVMLEEGGYRTRRDFDMREDTAYPALYQELGNRTTDDLAITLLQGRTVGGGTTVNWSVCFRTPTRILDVWRDVHGVEGIHESTLAPHWEWMERRLHIREWPLELLNRNNQVLWNGTERLGYSRELLKRNVHNCINLGSCGHGCPVDAKQSMLVTLIPDAVERGMTLFANTSARRLEVKGRRVTAVHAEVLDPATQLPTGVKLTVRAKVTAVCGGAINSPGLLLRSGLTGNGQVGRRLFLHPVVASGAFFDEPVDGFNGAPMSVGSHQFMDRGPGHMGYLIEVPPIHPMLSAIVFPGFGAQHQEFMSRLRHLNALIAITLDGVLPEDEGGTVALRRAGEGRYRIDYPLREHNWEAFRHALKEMARIQLAAGAREVLSPHSTPVVMRTEADLAKLDDAPYAPLQLKVSSAHQMGGCCMGKDPERSVVDSRFRYHHLDNLFVADASVFPTALGVNPQHTIYGLARLASGFVAGAV